MKNRGVRFFRTPRYTSFFFGGIASQLIGRRTVKDRWSLLNPGLKVWLTGSSIPDAGSDP